jgi:hypothetical protein
VVSAKEQVVDGLTPVRFCIAICWPLYVMLYDEHVTAAHVGTHVGAT